MCVAFLSLSNCKSSRINKMEFSSLAVEEYAVINSLIDSIHKELPEYNIKLYDSTLTPAKALLQSDSQIDSTYGREIVEQAFYNYFDLSNKTYYVKTDILLATRKNYTCERKKESEFYKSNCFRLKFSRVGFDAKKNFACVYVVTYFSKLTGYGEIYFLSKQNDKWVIVKKQDVFNS